MKNTVNIPFDKLDEIKSSLQNALDFIDGLQKKEKKPRITKAERRRMEVQRLLKDI